MNISVIGAGYVGLITATGFAEMGNSVFCIDIDQEKIENINSGVMPIYEAGLKDLVERNIRAERIIFSCDLSMAVEKSDIVFIAVDTPSQEDGSVNLSFVNKVASDIGEFLSEYKVIVLKSTVPVGTNRKIRSIIDSKLNERGLKVEFSVVSNPEFLKEGVALNDFMRPDRIVVGCDEPKASQIDRSLYEPFVRNGHPIYFMDIESAELTKYAANAMLATKISFMNEISRLCEVTGADIENLRKGIGSDSRIGFDFIYAGVGYGGSCFPKDIRALLHLSSEMSEEMNILRSVDQVNKTQKARFFKTIRSHFNNNLEGRVFGVWGLAFKPGTDDMREAPSLYIIKELTRRGAQVQVYDPVAMITGREAIGVNPNVKYMPSPYQAVEGADAMVLLTDWTEFRRPDLDKMASLMKEPLVFDGRNQFDPKVMRDAGFEYYSVGRKLRTSFSGDGGEGAINHRCTQPTVN